MQKIILHIGIVIITFFGILQAALLNSNATESILSLSPESYDVLFNTDPLQAEGIGAFNSYNEFYMNADPNLIVFGIDGIYQDINNKLYDNYGWDLETGWGEYGTVEEEIDANIKETLAKGELVGSAFKLYWNAHMENFDKVKTFILGKTDEVTGEITEVFNNAYTKVTDEVLRQYINVKNALVTDNKIINNTIADCYYGTSFTFTQVSGSTTYTYYITFAAPVIAFCTLNPNASQGAVQFVSPQFPSISSIMVHVVSSSSDSFKTPTLDSHRTVNTFIVDGVTYTSYDFTFKQGSNYYTVRSNDNIGSLANSQAFVEAYDPFGLSKKAYAFEPTIYSTINSMLKQLQDTWVSTDDLKSINDEIGKLNVGAGAVALNPVIDTDLDSLLGLQALIYDILARNAELTIALEDTLPPPTPDPDPDDEDTLPEYPIPIPSWIVPDFLTDLFDSDMFSMFQPIFDMVGTNNSIYSLWILIPTILIFIFILYIIVSVL